MRLSCSRRTLHEYRIIMLNASGYFQLLTVCDKREKDGWIFARGFCKAFTDGFLHAFLGKVDIMPSDVA